MTNNNSEAKCECECIKCTTSICQHPDKCFRIYQQQWEMIEKINEQRGRVETLYKTLLSALIVAFGYVLAEHPTYISEPIPFLFGGVVVGVLAIAWFFRVRFYSNLILVKLKILDNMEKRLQTFQFAKQENDLLGRKGYKLRSVCQFCKLPEAWPPLLFLFISIGAIIYGFNFWVLLLVFLAVVIAPGFVACALFRFICCCTCGKRYCLTFPNCFLYNPFILKRRIP